MSRLFFEYLKHAIRANNLLLAPGDPAVRIDFYGDPRHVHARHPHPHRTQP